jgi:phage/plasmid-like protein (TIGR03299 family)
MVAAVQSMAYVGETPWHGLGNKLTEAVGVDEMTKAAGLDWSVAQHPMFVEVGGKRVEVPGKVAVTREDTLDVLSVSSKQWKPFQNKDLMEFFREYVEAGAATLETAGSLREGKVIWALANLNKGFTLNGRDRVNGYLLFSNSHEPGASIRVLTTMVRVVCQNTLSLAHGSGDEMYRQSHVKDFDMASAKSTVEFAREGVELHKLEAEALMSLELSAYDTVRTLAKHFQPDMANTEEDVKILLANPAAQSPVFSEVLHSVVMAPGAMPENAWGLLNGVTHWADHVAGRNTSSRLMNATFGRNAKIKLDVRRDLLEMADYSSEMA